MPETKTFDKDLYFRKKAVRKLCALIKSRNLNLTLLRTCRRIHAEGSEVYYGENEFRFSAMKGHMHANLFMRKIYKQHYQWLKILTIAMPICGRGKMFSQQDMNRALSCSLTQSSDRNQWAQPLFASWHDKDFCYEEAFEHLMQKLTRADRFEKLVLLLPDYYETYYTLSPRNTGREDINRVHMFAQDRNWVILKDFVDARVQQRMDGKLTHIHKDRSALHIEVVRLDHGSALWEFEVPEREYRGPDWVLLTALAGEHVVVSIRKARVGEDGHWEIVPGRVEYEMYSEETL